MKAGCAYSQDGKPQAGMGVGVGDYDRNGTTDILKTNFAGDTTTLYANMGDGFCEDRTFDSGLGLNTRWLGWGAGFADFDNDGGSTSSSTTATSTPKSASCAPRPDTSSGKWFIAT